MCSLGIRPLSSSIMSARTLSTLSIMNTHGRFAGTIYLHICVTTISHLCTFGVWISHVRTQNAYFDMSIATAAWLVRVGSFMVAREHYRTHFVLLAALVLWITKTLLVDECQKFVTCCVHMSSWVVRNILATSAVNWLTTVQTFDAITVYG